MKNLKLIAVLIVIISLFSCNGSDCKVPKKVLTAFETAYPDAKDVEWEKDGKNFEVEFMKDGVEVEISYDIEGNLLGIEVEDDNHDDDKDGHDEDHDHDETHDHDHDHDGDHEESSH